MPKIRHRGYAVWAAVLFFILVAAVAFGGGNAWFFMPIVVGLSIAAVRAPAPEKGQMRRRTPRRGGS